MLNKNRFALLLIAILLISASIPVFGQGYDVSSKITFEQEAIKDLDVLFDRAINGITDRMVPESVSKVVNEKDQEEIEIPVFTTTQILRIEEKNGIQETTYSTTSFMVTPMSTLTKSDDEEDDYIRAWGTITWKESTINHVKHYDLTNVQGGWGTKGIGGSQVTLSGRKVTIGQSGSLSTGAAANYSIDRFPATNSYSYAKSNFGSNWQPVNIDYFGGDVGMRTRVTATLGSNSWFFYFNLLYPG